MLTLTPKSALVPCPHCRRCLLKNEILCDPMPPRLPAPHAGFNRTGFVVCSYLCQACGLTVQQALDSFAAARPPGVKHEKFIAGALRRRPQAARAYAWGSGACLVEKIVLPHRRSAS